MNGDWVNMLLKRLRKTVSIFLILVLAFNLCACASADDAADKNQMTGSESETSVNEEDLASELMQDDTAPSDEAVIVSDEENETEDENDNSETDSSGISSGLVINKNLLDNGDFHSDMAHWGTYTAKGGNCVFTAPGGEGKVSITNSGNVNYAVQAFYDGFELKNGGVYEFSFKMSSDKPRNIEARIQINGGDYHAYIDVFEDIDENMNTYSTTFTMEEGSDPAPRLCFNLGTPEGSDELGEHVVRIDDVALKLVDASGIKEAVVEDHTVSININQVGYLKDSVKIAMSNSSKVGDSFKVVDVKSGKTCFEGKYDTEVYSRGAGENVVRGDFSAVKEEGTYRIEDATGSSYEFKVGDKVYNDLLKDAFRFLYTQRCGIEIEEKYAGSYAHKPCHTGEATIHGTNNKKKVIGGWHDAGDYGRYVVPGAVTVADLFLAYEDARELWDSKWGDSMDIPESGNGIPDILDEAKYELDWMLMMQDEASGGVYHKITCREFPGFVMPEEETEELVLSPISNTATADFAAVMAKASVIYKDIEPKFATDCLTAAKKAWKYLETAPVGQGFKNPDDIVTGEYPDMRDPDERYWASVELYSATGDETYAKYLRSILDQYVKDGYGWADVSSYGNRAYLGMDKSKQEEKYVKLISEHLKNRAQELTGFIDSDGYMCDLGEDYIWGSNMDVLNRARMILDSVAVNGGDKNKAYQQLSYLLGANTLSQSYVTGYGTVRTEHPHHRVAIVKQYALPGMVAGGPNKNIEDPFAKSTLQGVSPAKCYVDNEQSYSTNEVTIYWNSPLIYLLSTMINGE